MAGRAFLCLLLITCVHAEGIGPSLARVDLELSPQFRKISTEFECLSDGFFSLESDCSKFIRCTRYSKTSTVITPFEFQCPDGTIWDNGIESCTFGKCPSSASKDKSSSSGAATKETTKETKGDTTANGAAVGQTSPEGEAPGKTQGPKTEDKPVESSSKKKCSENPKSYVVSDEFCNLFFRCTKPNEKYVCNPGSAFDDSSQICLDAITHPALCTNKKEYKQGSSLRSDLPSEVTALIPLLESPVQNSEYYKLVSYNPEKTYGPKGLEAWVVPLDPEDPSYRPLRAEAAQEADLPSGLEGWVVPLDPKDPSYKPLTVETIQNADSPPLYVEKEENPSSLTEKEDLSSLPTKFSFGNEKKPSTSSPLIRFSFQSQPQNIQSNFKSITDFLRSVVPNIENAEVSSVPLTLPVTSQLVTQQQNVIPYQFSAPQISLVGQPTVFPHGQLPYYSLNSGYSPFYNIRTISNTPLPSLIGGSTLVPGNTAVKPVGGLLGQNLISFNEFWKNLFGQNKIGQNLIGQNLLGQIKPGQNLIGQIKPGQGLIAQNQPAQDFFVNNIFQPGTDALTEFFNSLVSNLIPHRNRARLEIPLAEVDFSSSQESIELDDQDDNSKESSSLSSLAVTSKAALPQKYNILPFPGHATAQYNPEKDHLAVPFVDPINGMVHYAAYEL